MREKTTKCFWKAAEVLLDVNRLSLLFIKVKYLQIALRATQTTDVLISFRKIFYLMSDLKFTFSDVTSFLPDSLSGLKKLYSGL